MRVANPTKLVLVERDGHWHLGELRAWRRADDGGWLANVIYSVAVGIRHIDWVEAERVRQMASINSPDNLDHSAPTAQAPADQLHNAYAVGTPKMPGEPPRVQPSKKNAANWENT
jgi:hypothetical protein